MTGKQGRRGWGWIRRLPSSRRYQASYIWPPELATRHYAPGTFTAKMDAEHWLSDERRLIDQGLWTSPKMRAAQQHTEALTLNEYADQWIEQRNVKPGTRIEYKRIKTRLIADTLGKLALKTISPDMVRAWYATLGTGTPTRNSHAYSLLHSIMATAVGDQLIPANPCHIARAMSPQRKREPNILTVNEVAAVADAIEPPRLRCFVLLAAWCGLRWGEAIELRRKDFDETCQILLVARAVTHRSGCLISTPKSGKPRAVVVPPHIRADLLHHFDAYVGNNADALVFPALRDGCHLNDSVFAKHFRPALKTVGREGVRIHDLRHFAGTMTARVANLTETMGRLGHSTVRASLIYQGIVSGRDAEVAAALSELAEQTD